jgi:hypothetical protein
LDANCEVDIVGSGASVASGLEGYPLRLRIRGVSKTFGEWYQKTNKTEDTNKLTLLAFKIIVRRPKIRGVR